MLQLKIDERGLHSQIDSALRTYQPQPIKIPVELDFRAAPNHSIARNFTTAKFVDETYWRLGGELKPGETLATGTVRNRSAVVNAPVCRKSCTLRFVTGTPTAAVP